MPQTQVGRDAVKQAVRPIRVGVVFAAFPAKDMTPYKYFILLLNSLQRSCEFELFDINGEDDFVKSLSSRIVDADAARNGLEAFGVRIRNQISMAIQAHDLAIDQPDQLIVITGVTLSDYHYLIRRGRITMLAVGQWETTMSPPSLAEFLQLLALRAPFSALEGHVWDGIHLGSRGCIFDFTENLDNARLMALAGVGVCSDCASALTSDGFPDAGVEIKRVASRDWRGERTLPGSPASIMARLGYDLFLTKGFEPTFYERLGRVFANEGVKFLFAVLIAWLIFKAGWK